MKLTYGAQDILGWIGVCGENKCLKQNQSVFIELILKWIVI